jgi:ribonuclease BN (tRNA processing enzyme)/CheY-like chemotaxis protein
MRVRFWGTRGSIPKPGPTTLRYGGNTSCASVETDDGTLLVLDCGTGCHELARTLGESPARARRGHLLLTHLHWDHIQGFPFFDPLYGRDNAWDVWAPGGQAKPLRASLAAQMSYEHFPVGLDDVESALGIHELREGGWQIGSVRVTSQYLNHPTLTLGYRIEADGAVLVYATDHEPHALPAPSAGPAPLVHAEDLRHARFLEGADLVIHDAQYLLAEFPARSGWGHSPVESVVDYAVAAGVPRVALHHHDPRRDDDGVDRATELAQQRAARAPQAPEVFAAREGAVIELAPAAKRRCEARPAPRDARLAGERAAAPVVLAVATRAASLRAIETAVAGAGIRVIACDDAQAALARAADAPVGLCIVDAERAGAAERDACRRLRENERFAPVPVLLIGDARAGAEELAALFDAGCSDFVARPVKATLLRARVRSWLLRAPGA